jgi:hypothetical protein
MPSDFVLYPEQRFTKYLILRIYLWDLRSPMAALLPLLGYFSGLPKDPELRSAAGDSSAAEQAITQRME